MTELRKAGHIVIPSDLGNYENGFSGVDFLRYPNTVARNIVTNPPYRNGLHERFVQRALFQIERTGGIAALLLPLYFLAGTRRAKAFQNHPAAEVYIIDHMSFAVEELPETVHGGPVRIDVAWFVWRAGYRGPTSLSWLSIDEYA